MKPYEFKRFYHPRLGKFVFQHKGSGIIIDNIFKDIKAIISSDFKKVAKPMARKALESGVSHAGDKIGKKVAKKSGDLIMKNLSKMRQGSTKQQKIIPIQPITQQQDTNMILNRLISGSGIKRKRKIM